ncbi:MAG: NAD-dependent epimerase [Candidatus Cohnella colombiensis]|uniref:NAD-dependent epimerase n=1 Tax=Candidatus Cohnella colombiensis TaxID=3121368 RepID=A0AA95EUE3_9BACL|nr:MAG: NAD-dependent epimerase [Cohnella sp.]
MKLLVTGSAGFIGFYVATRWLAEGHEVIGFDSVNDYYDPQLKEDRLKLLMSNPNFKFVKGNLEDKEQMNELFVAHQPEVVVHLAAQAGVRYSLDNPQAYIDANVTGFLNILEACRNHRVNHLLYASSSSVYGSNTAMPFSTSQNISHPVSLYAATKRANELMAHTYSHLFQIPTTGLRFFTVYGPWGRPDMALFKFTSAIMNDKPISVFNHGQMRRDFTYIDDIVDGIIRLIPNVPQPDPQWSGHLPDPASSYAPYRIYNIGNNQPVNLMDFITQIEQAVGKKALINFEPLQPGDVPETYADIDPIREVAGFEPKTPITIGIPQFVEWYKSYYGQRGD